MDESKIDSPEWRKLVGKDDQVFSDSSLAQAQVATDASMVAGLAHIGTDAYVAACEAVGVSLDSPAASRYCRAVDAAIAVAMSAELRRLASAWEHLRAVYPGEPDRFDQQMGQVGGYVASLRQTASVWERRHG
jgi:hypothetical protein